MIKKYIAPVCEVVNLAAPEMLAMSFKIDPDTEVSTQLSNEMIETDWDEE